MSKNIRVTFLQNENSIINELSVNVPIMTKCKAKFACGSSKI